MLIFKKYLTLLLLIICFVVSTNLFSQQNINTYLALSLQQSRVSNYDSSIYLLTQALAIAEQTEDQNQEAYLIKRLGTEYIFWGKYDTALIYLNKSRLLAEELQNDTVLANANLNIGYAMFSKGKTDTAEFIFKRSLNQFENISDTAGIAQSYNLLTILYKYTSDYGKGLEAALKSTFYYKKLNNTQLYIRSLINLGNIYEKLGDLDTAYSCYQICHNESLKYNKLSQALTVLINMAVIDYNKGVEAKNYNQTEIAEKYFTKSKESYLKAIEISNEKKDNHSLALSYARIAQIFIEFDQFQEAIEYSKKALGLANSSGEKNRQIDALITLGISHTKIRNYPKARSYFLKSLELAIQSKYKEKQKTSIENLSYVSELMGDYKMSLYYYKQAVVVQDSIMNEEKIRAIETERNDIAG